MNIKILVCYHKKDRLFKNDVLVPIHCGRAVAKEKHKDGKISEKDYDWLINNMIGDDTGDNVSHLNREINEASAIYWAWKNYDKLGNPDYIGLCHYRRLFDFSGGGVPIFKFLILLSSGNRKRVISKILEKCDFIVRTPFPADDLLIKNMDAFQNIIKLSDKNHPNLYESIKTLRKNKKYFCNNMFVMSRADFFDYCNEIFPVMFDFLNIENRADLFLKNISKTVEPDILKKYDDGKVWVPRLTAFFVEYLTSFYLMYMMKTKKHIELDIIETEFEKRKILKNLFSITRKSFHGSQYRVVYFMGIILKIKRLKDE